MIYFVSFPFHHHLSGLSLFHYFSSFSPQHSLFLFAFTVLPAFLALPTASLSGEGPLEQLTSPSTHLLPVRSKRAACSRDSALLTWLAGHLAARSSSFSSSVPPHVPSCPIYSCRGKVNFSQARGSTS